MAKMKNTFVQYGLLNKSLEILKAHMLNGRLMLVLTSSIFLFQLGTAHAQNYEARAQTPSILDQASEDHSGEQERLGKVYLSDIFLSPRFNYAEPKSGSFMPGNSYLAGDWTRGDAISGHLAFGTKSLIGVPARYGIVNDQDFVLVEGYAQIVSNYGRFRLGLQPIPFGMETGINEANLRFERSLIYQKRLMGIRDVGLGYSITNDGFFSDWLIHNGEGGRDLDNQTWFTARLGYHKDNLTGGLSGQTGKTSPLSTDPTGNLAATPGGSLQTTGINIDDGAKYRLLNLFIAYRTKDIETGLEFTSGDIFQSQTQSHPSGGHVDVFLPFGEVFAAMFRYDYFDPKNTIDPTNQQYTLGACFRSPYETSNIYIFGSRNVLPAGQSDSHQVLLVWRVSPFASKY